MAEIWLRCGFVCGWEMAGLWVVLWWDVGWCLVVGGRSDNLKIRLTQPNWGLAGAELGKNWGSCRQKWSHFSRFLILMPIPFFKLNTFQESQFFRDRHFSWVKIRGSTNNIIAKSPLLRVFSSHFFTHSVTQSLRFFQIYPSNHSKAHIYHLSHI